MLQMFAIMKIPLLFLFTPEI